MPRGRPLLPGFQRVPGRAERYTTPGGGTISRRQYENQLARSAGWSSWSEYQRVARTQDYRRNLRIMSEERDITPRQAAGATSEFSHAYAEFRQAGAYKGSKAPTGAWAQLQVTQGLRQPDANWDIGDTPK